MESKKPVPYQEIISAIRAVETEAASRGSMFPQDRDEQEKDSRAVRRVVEMIEWYATKGGSVATSLPGWPKHPEQPKEIERLEKTITLWEKINHNMITGLQAAWIEWHHGKGAEEAMEWIHNILVGPGHIPNEDAQHGKEAQEYYNKKSVG